MELVTYLLFISTIVIQIYTHKRCISDEISKGVLVEKVYLEHSKDRFLQTSSWTPIRILVDYTTLNSQNISDSEKNDIKSIIDSTTSIYQKLLSVQSSTSKLSIQKCNNSRQTIAISPTVKAGVFYDLILFPYMDESAADDIEAYAAFCNQDANTGRPVAGFIGFGNISLKLTNSLSYYQILVLHEMNHILAFHESLFPDFIDSNGNLLKNPMTTKIVNGESRHLLSTPSVVAAAQEHFGCSSITGVELENQGGSGTAGSHWEARMMLNDFMIGQSFPEQTISKITLAVFIDSGWYQVNDYSGGLFRYGKNAGCSFVNSKCVSNNIVSDSNIFSNKISVPMCLANHSGKGVSSLRNNVNINNTNYEYFSSATEGGYELADFCPVAVANTNVNGYFFPTSCVYGALSGFPTTMGEVIGKTSNCFISSLTPNGDKISAAFKGQTNAICYPTTCNSSTGTYDITIINTTFTCPRAGGLVSVSGFDGVFNCPDYNKICTRNGICSDAIDCATKGISTLKANYDYVAFQSQDVSGPYTAATMKTNLPSSNDNNENPKTDIKLDDKTQVDADTNSSNNQTVVNETDKTNSSPSNSDNNSTSNNQTKNTSSSTTSNNAKGDQNQIIPSTTSSEFIMSKTFLIFILVIFV